MSRKKALISGVTGQDGAYLARLLLDKGYEVHGIKRRASSFNTQRIDGIYDDPRDDDISFALHYGDMTDSSNVMRLVQEIEPDEIYNLAAQSHVQVSFETAEYTANVDAFGTLRFLEAIRTLGMQEKTRFYQASTSELYGKTQTVPQNEMTPFYPRSPYGVAKLFSYWSVVNYREAHGLCASNGIMFNHESPLRGMDFVTRKITATLAQIACGGQQMLILGNLDNARDWGFAGDYVEAMWLMLQQPQADDYIIASGETHSVREFVLLAAETIGLDIEFEGAGLETRAIDKKTGRQVIGVSADFYRPSEPDPLIGNASKAQKHLNWRPKVSFEQLVALMAESDLARARNGQVWY